MRLVSCLVEDGQMICVLEQGRHIYQVRLGVGPRDFADIEGLAVGGAWGMKEGLSRPLGDSPSMKLRINAILNGCTRRGSFLGNSLGVLGKLPDSLASLAELTSLAIFYNIVNSSMDSYRGRHDIINAMTAGAVSGAIFKSTCKSYLCALEL